MSFAKICLLLTPLAALLAGAAPQSKADAELRISGPYSHDNLSIFLLHGEDRLAGKKLLTLSEALAQKKVVVHETGDVNELSIENKSDESVFIQAGDIVKGGKQDRVLSLSVVLSPKSGKIPVSAFCVEQGRWSARSGESVAQFSSSAKAVSSKKLKIAARKAGSQGEVWKEVAETQTKLSKNLKAEVKSAQSETSLQLTMETTSVKRSADEYIKKLSNVLDGKNDVVGYAFAINGKINSAEVYASPSLLVKLWPKLLESNAIEALAEREENAKAAPPAPAPAEVQKLISAKPDPAKRSQKKVGKSITLTSDETEDGKMRFETRDDASGTPIHTSYY